MQHDHSSMIDHKHPDYEFHMPRLFTYPLPVGIVSVLLAGLLYFLLRESQPTLAGVLAGLSLNFAPFQLNREKKSNRP
jgi:hypothetical protein